MSYRSTSIRWTLAALAATAAVIPAQAQQAGAPLKIGIVSFLTGPAAAPFGMFGQALLFVRARRFSEAEKS